MLVYTGFFSLRRQLPESRVRVNMWLSVPIRGLCTISLACVFVYRDKFRPHV